MTVQSDVHIFEWVSLGSKTDKIKRKLAAAWTWTMAVWHCSMPLLLPKKSTWLVWNPKFTDPSCLDLTLS